MTRPLVLISGCLAGLRCRYDGKVLTDLFIQNIVSRGEVIVVCPEQLGGLPTPRPASRIVGGDGFDVHSGNARVVSENGEVVMHYFLMGAEETLRVAQMAGVKKVIIKDKSPSCGVKQIHGGDQHTDGCGVTTALLIKEGFRVVAAEELD